MIPDESEIIVSHVLSNSLAHTPPGAEFMNHESLSQSQEYLLRRNVGQAPTIAGSGDLGISRLRKVPSEHEGISKISNGDSPKRDSPKSKPIYSPGSGSSVDPPGSVSKKEL